MATTAPAAKPLETYPCLLHNSNTCVCVCVCVCVSYGEGGREGVCTCSEGESVSLVNPASLASLPTLDILC